MSSTTRTRWSTHVVVAISGVVVLVVVIAVVFVVAVAYFAC